MPQGLLGLFFFLWGGASANLRAQKLTLVTSMDSSGVCGGTVEMGVSSAMELVDSLLPLLRHLNAMGCLLKCGQKVWWAVQDTRECLGSNVT